MTVSVRLQTGGIEPILIQEQSKPPLTGLTDLAIYVRRESDNLFFDFAGAPANTFRVAPVKPDSAALVQVDATLAKGLYVLTGGFNESLITNPNANDTLHVIPVQTIGTNAALPDPGEIKVGQFADNLDAKISSVRNDETHMGVSYDDAIMTLRLTVCLQRGNIPVTSGLVEAIVTWFDLDGTVLFTQTETAPTGALDANGVFRFTQIQTLIDNQTYYVDISVEDAAGIVVTRRKVPVIA